jgi:hypothetical protein
MRDGNNVEGQDKKAECEAAAVCNTMHHSSSYKTKGASTTPRYLVPFGLFNLSPGSPIARTFGCSCREHDGSEMFACEYDCSVHGLELLMSALDETSGGAFEFGRA